MAGLIDFHSHFFSRTFFETLAEASSLPGTVADRMFHVATEVGLELPSPSVEEHVACWVGDLDRYGVEHLVTFASVPEEASTVAEALTLAEGRFSGFVVTNPSIPEAPDRVAACFDDHGYRGVLVFPAMHGFAVDGEDFAEVLRVVGAREGVVVVHCGQLRVALRDKFGLPRGYDLRLADPLALVPVADAHPDVRFVIPHFGAGFFRETLIAGAQCSNVHVDTSSANGWVDTQPHALRLLDVFDRTLGVFGPERVLFGTDSSVFPRGWRHDILIAQREILGALGTSDQDLERILGGNAARLLGL